MTHKKVVLVALSGCSSSGKTTLAKLTAEALPDATLIHEDDFYKHDDEIPYDEHFKINNWDSPDALDLNLFKKELDHIKSTGEVSTKLIHNNNVDDISKFKLERSFLENLKQKYAKYIDSGDLKIVLVDGFMIYHDPELSSKFDLKILVRAPYSTLKKRRAARSGYQTLDSFWVDPPFYFDEFVYKSYAKAHSFLFNGSDVEGTIKDDTDICVLDNDEGTDIKESLLWIYDRITNANF